MICRIIYKEGIPYVEMNDGKHYKIRQREFSAGGQKYQYYVVKIPVGRYQETLKIRQHDVTGTTLEELIAALHSLLALSDEDMQLTNTHLSIREISRQWLDLNSIAWDHVSYLANQRAADILCKDEIAAYAPVELTESILIEWQKRILSQKTTAFLFQQWRCLRQIIHFSQAHHYTFFDPTQYSKIFRYQPKEMLALSKDQLWQLLCNNKNGSYCMLYAIILLCGLRISEATGLTWDDVDFSNRCVHIHRQCKYNHAAARDELVPYTKTRYPRTIFPPECFFWCLRKQKAIQKKLAESPTYNNHYNLILTNRNGEPLNKDSARQRMSDSLSTDESGLVSPHDLRCTCATYGVRLTGDVCAAQHYLGHRHKSTLMDYLCSDDESIDKMLLLIEQHITAYA